MFDTWSSAGAALLDGCGRKVLKVQRHRKKWKTREQTLMFPSLALLAVDSLLPYCGLFVTGSLKFLPACLSYHDKTHISSNSDPNCILLLGYFLSSTWSQTNNFILRQQVIYRNVCVYNSYMHATTIIREKEAMNVRR